MRLIDFGDKIEASEMYQLPEELKQIPAISVCVLPVGQNQKYNNYPLKHRLVDEFALMKIRKSTPTLTFT